VRLYRRERPDIVHAALKPVLYGRLYQAAGPMSSLPCRAGRLFIKWTRRPNLASVICRLLAWLLSAPHSRTTCRTRTTSAC
jgi:hypothetical protein